MKSYLKKKTVLERIKTLENELAKAHEYLESGSNPKWHRFKPLFTDKVRDGKILPPHKDWVKSTFIPRCERGLAYLEKLVDRLEDKK